MSQESMRAIRLKINNSIEDARVNATYAVLRQYCHEVDIKIQKKFCQCPTMQAVNCPYSRNGSVCDTCDHLVQYSLKNKKAYCIDRSKFI